MALIRRGVPDPPDEFAAAREVYRRAEQEFQLKSDAVDDARAALIWANASEIDKTSDRLNWARDRVAKAFPRGVPRARRLPALFQQAEEDLEDAMPAWRAAQEQWAIAKRNEANRLARLKQPEHRQAVIAIARALEALSIAITAECEVREQFLRVSPEGRENRHLPDSSWELALVGTLGDWKSNASAWARRMRKLKILD